MVNAGYGIEFLKEAGFTLQELIRVGAQLKQSESLMLNYCKIIVP